MPPTYSLIEALQIIQTSNFEQLTAIVRVVTLEADRYTQREMALISEYITNRRIELQICN